MEGLRLSRSVSCSASGRAVKRLPSLAGPSSAATTRTKISAGVGTSSTASGRLLV